jgi:hypothetical protein
MTRRNMHGRFDWEAARLERQQLLERLDADMSAEERAELAAHLRAARRARRLSATASAEQAPRDLSHLAW